MLRAARPRTASALAVLIGAVSGWVAALDVRVALVSVGAALVAVLVYVGPGLLLLGLVGSEPWSGLLAFPTATFTIPKIIGFLAMASFALAAATGRVKLRHASPIGWALGFLLAILISLMLSQDPAAGVTKTVSYALYVLVFVLLVQLIHTRAQVERYLAVYTASAAIAGLYGLVAFLSGTVGRAGGPITDPNDFALLLAGAIPLAVFFVGHSRRYRVLWALAMVVLASACLATFSRGALVGLAVVFLWAVLSRRISLPTVSAVVLAIGAVAAVLYVSYRPLIDERLVQKQYVANANVASRMVFWSAAVRMTLDHPIVGVGPARFGQVSEQYLLNDPIVLQDPVVHNSYLEILAESGPAALALFLCLLGSVWRILRRLRTEAIALDDRDERRLIDALQASFLWTLVAAVFVSRQLSISIWLLAGLATCLALAPRGDARLAEARPNLRQLALEQPGHVNG
jgi:O-antigen ligase